MDIRAFVAAGLVAGLSNMGWTLTPAIIPAPQSLSLAKGTVSLSQASVIAAAPSDTAAREAAERLAEFFPTAAARIAATDPNAVMLFSSKAGLPAEGYAIRPVGTKAFTIEASDAAGFFYAIQTLRQLGEKQADGSYAFPRATIEDAPRFSWRGFMIDEGRHFFGKEAVKKLLGLMAYHKLNTFHWHLTEDQGWRLTIDAYPELTRYGAVRPCSPAHGNRHQSDGTVYGPFFYSKADVKEILAYAKRLHIRVVPEIDLPGHTRAVLAAYPEFSCVGPTLSPRTPWTRWGVSEDVLCAGNDQAIHFLEVVLDEVCALFDSPFIHVGGDECPRVRWKTCPKCQARIKAEGLKDEHELQAWVTRHFERYLAQKGRRLIGWDEILEGNIPASATVMSWRGTQGGIAAATAGHDVVMAPTTFCYLDYRQFKGDDGYEYIGGFLPLSKVYSFDPCAGIPPAQQKHVLGGQCNNWSEYTWTLKDLEWKAYPRAAALAERVWTQPNVCDYSNFLKRLATHRARLLTMGVNVAPIQPEK